MRTLFGSKNFENGNGRKKAKTIFEKLQVPLRNWKQQIVRLQLINFIKSNKHTIPLCISQETYYNNVIKTLPLC